MNNGIPKAFYYQIYTTFTNNTLSNREKILHLYDSVKSLFVVLSENETISFTEFARFNFILHKHKADEQLKKEVANLRRLIGKLRKLKYFNPNDNTIKNTISICCKLIFQLTNTEIPDYIVTLLTDYTIQIENEQVEEIETLPSLHCVYIANMNYNNSILLLCNDDDGNKIIVITNTEKYQMCSPMWKNCTLCITNLVITDTPISQYDEENEIFSTSVFYTSTDNTLIILEPDYLVDVTEITDCFNNNSEYPIIPILNKFLNRIVGTSAFEGNIINSFLDELLENIETDFHSAVNNALQLKPLQMLTTIQHYNSNGYVINNYNDLIIYMHKNLYDVFAHLRNIIIDNFIEKTIRTEPSFLSNIYGLQGRLDIIVENTEHNIDIVELKSGAAPKSNRQYSIGLYTKRKLFLPLWINHYVQIICYNMLLQQYFDGNDNKNKGLSSILYSKPGETDPIRSVVDNQFVQIEVISNRNWLVAYHRELALGNTKIFDAFDNNSVNLLPKYSRDDAKSFISKYRSLSDIERAYFQQMLIFISKDGFSQKTGLFASNSHTGSSSGFAELWLLSLEEKMLKGSVIPNLSINTSNSDFAQMHIWYNIGYKDIYSTSFRKGDICLLYPQLDNITPANSQLMRGRIVEIDAEHIVVSFRNKLSQNHINCSWNWCLEGDYMEVSNKYLYSSLSNYMFASFSNKQAILGLQKPTFKHNETIKKIVNNITELSAEKQEIIISALTAQNYYLIQGPPGTGKTSFILRYIVQILLRYTSENILILAYTNRAVDEICSSINEIEDINYLRLGNKDSSEHTDRLLSNIALEYITEAVDLCHCFVSTIATANSNSELFQLKKFDTIIADEAAQVLECHIIGLLSKAQRFIMIGDEKQLPAVTSVAPKELIVNNDILHTIELTNLGDSLFERLLRLNKNNYWTAYSMLCEQSRMSSEIMQVSNNLFYNNQLRLNPLVANKQNEPNSISFINTSTEAGSKINNMEIEIVLKLIAEITEQLGGQFNNRSIGVISPWRKQCSAIISRLDNKFRNFITVDTVERFQGSERDIIIYSTATNNLHLLNLLSESNIIDGTLVDRKLNVVITRAKQRLIILGNRDLLCQKEIYSKLIAMIE